MYKYQLRCFSFFLPICALLLQLCQGMKERRQQKMVSIGGKGRIGRVSPLQGLLQHLEVLAIDLPRQSYRAKETTIF